jgi:hypothetical protein
MSHSKAYPSICKAFASISKYLEAIAMHSGGLGVRERGWRLEPLGDLDGG